MNYLSHPFFTLLNANISNYYTDVKIKKTYCTSLIKFYYTGSHCVYITLCHFVV